MKKLFIILFMCISGFTHAQTQTNDFCNHIEGAEFYLETPDFKRATGGVIGFKNGLWTKRGSFIEKGTVKTETETGKYYCTKSSITIYETSDTIVTFKILDVEIDKFQVLRIKFADEGGNFIGYFTKTCN